MPLCSFFRLCIRLFMVLLLGLGLAFLSYVFLSVKRRLKWEKMPSFVPPYLQCSCAFMIVLLHPISLVRSLMFYTNIGITLHSCFLYVLHLTNQFEFSFENNCCKDALGTLSSERTFNRIGEMPCCGFLNN